MDKTYNPEEISSTLEADFFESSGARESHRKANEPTTSASIVDETKIKEEKEENKKFAATKKSERKLPDWMVKAGQEKSQASQKKPVEKVSANKSSSQKNPDDIYIMSDEDLLEVARYFIKHK